MFNGYLEKRGISEQVAQDAGIFWEKTNKERLVIPIKDKDGNILFKKYRKNPEQEDGPKYQYDYGSHASLFGVDTINDETKIVYICEGELDALCLRSQLNDSSVATVSSTGGCGVWKPEWNEFLVGKDIRIVYDTDAPGIVGALKLGAQIPDAFVGFLAKQFPMEPKDITEIFQRMETREKFLRWFKKTQYEQIELPMSNINLEGKQALLTQWDELHQKQNKTKDQFYWTKIALDYINSLRIYEPVRKNEMMPRDGDSVLQKAKLYPIDDLIKFNHNGKANCLWHTDKTASMVYYPEQNHVYCFGCAKKADAIDVYQKLNNVSMKEAITKLTT